MAEKITYYALFYPRPVEENPSGIARRIEDEVGFHDEQLARFLAWERTSVIVEWEHASSVPDLEEISEAEANELIERLRERWAHG